jgi:copper/silver efflux system protein
MIGGMLSSTVLTLIVIPAVYALIMGWRLPHVCERVEAAAEEGTALRPQARNEVSSIA